MSSSDEVPEAVDATPEQLAALAHPLRNRLVFALGDQGATISQLSVRLGTNKGNVAHHLAVLERAGLVRRAHTRQVRGGTEQYFARTARRLRTPGQARGGHTTALLEAIGEEIERSPTESLLTLRRVRLTQPQAQALAAHLERVVDELPAAGPAEPVYGVLVSVFRTG